MLKKSPLADGINEKGLAAGLFYHPGYAVYADYDKTQVDNTITAVDMIAFILSQFATVDEVKAGLVNVRMVGVVDSTKFNFNNKKIVYIVLDEKKEQDIKEKTPVK